MKFLFLVVFMAPVLSIADVMNLNEFVPTHLEDATPVDEHATIFQLSAHFEREDQDDVTWRPDIRYGLTKKIQLEVMADLITGGEENQSGETKAGIMYQLNESDSAFPVFSLNPIAQFPTGKDAEGIDLGMKLILSSTLSGTKEKPDSQLHLNLEHLHNAQRKAGERPAEHILSFGCSQRIREKIALVLDYYHEADTPDDRDEDFVEAGIHLQAGQRLYLSLGAGVDVGPGVPHWNTVSAIEYEI